MNFFASFSRKPAHSDSADRSANSAARSMATRRNARHVSASMIEHVSRMEVQE